MSEPTIICPQCAKVIPLSQALSEQIKHQFQADLSLEFQEKIKTLEKTQAAQLKAQETQWASQLKERQTQLEAEKQKIWAMAQNKAREKIDLELKDLHSQFSEKAKQLEAAQKNELDLRKKTRELEEQKQNMELQMQRKLDEERQKLVSDARKAEAEQQRLKVLEKDKQIEIMQKTIEELRQQSQQGSMQIQGEVQEDDLKQLLTNTFYTDTVTDVPTGIKGADLVQIVNNQVGQKAGVILWESKNTKTWVNDWIIKLKQDQGAAGADVCLLVSRVLPDDIKGFGVKNGVWILEYQYVVPLVTTIRFHLLELAKVKGSLIGRDQKIEYLYEYVSSTPFKNRIEAIVTAFGSMKADLDTERRAMERIWRKRSQEIERVIQNTAGLYGDLQGIVGASLPTIQALELPDGETVKTPAIEAQGLW